MKRWTAMACATILAGCAGPQISLTDASPRRVAFLVHNAWLVPRQDLDAQAASYCRQHGRAFRQANARWITPATKQVTYECTGAARPPPSQPEVGLAPVRRAHHEVRQPAVRDLRAAAWAKAQAATDTWALCLRFGAERQAIDTAEAPQLAALAVVHACSELEYAVHEPQWRHCPSSSR